MNSLEEAYRRGLERGFRLAADPSIENYRRLRTPRKQHVIPNPWEKVGDTMRATEKRLSEDNAATTSVDP